MVERPCDYRWSSYRHHATGSSLNLIDDHEISLRIASTPEQRMHYYRNLFCIVLHERDVHDVRRAATFSMLLGNNRFKGQIESALGQSIGYGKRGKPKKTEDCM